MTQKRRFATVNGYYLTNISGNWPSFFIPLEIKMLTIEKPYYTKIL